MRITSRNMASIRSSFLI